MDAQTMAQDLIEQSSSRTYDLFRINDIVQIKDTGVIGRITKVPREDVAEMVVWWWCGVVVRLIVLAEGIQAAKELRHLLLEGIVCVKM
jgi:hypothetical protein|tara:strand:- start:184 stop:450 length:267 start_codon:yes stop_codon:yes gene_type:complete